MLRAEMRQRSVASIDNRQLTADGRLFFPIEEMDGDFYRRSTLLIR